MKKLFLLCIGTMLFSNPSWAYMEISRLGACDKRLSLPSGYTLEGDVYGIEGPDECSKYYYCNDDTRSCVRISNCNYEYCSYYHNGTIRSLVELSTPPCMYLNYDISVCVPKDYDKDNCAYAGYGSAYERDDFPSIMVQEDRICNATGDGYWVIGWKTFCSPGFYGGHDEDYSLNLIQCNPCPYSDRDNITSAPGSSIITQCYAIDGYDETGSYVYSPYCYYQP